MVDPRPTQAALAAAFAAELKSAHEAGGFGSVRKVSADLGISHSTLARLRNEDLDAAGPKTLRRVADYYGIKLPSGLDLTEKRRGVAKARQTAAFCCAPWCPTSTVSLLNGEWVIRPRVLSVPASLFAQEDGGICRECGTALRRSCPNPSCGRPYNKGGFCPWCGQPYVARGNLDEDAMQELRDRSEAVGKRMDRVDVY